MVLLVLQFCCLFVLQFYFQNQDEIQDLQYNRLKKGFDQTPVNYLTRGYDVDLQILPKQCSLGALHQRGILNQGLFMEMGWVWQFNGIPKEDTKRIMEQVWETNMEKYK